ncbi:MAG: transcription termination factor NusA [Cardiobacteriaceae bacterium]|nr:transcription termination factor NusA [Cardiobacteriaceae bacterium]
MSKELLAIAEAVANERDISREAIFEALEAALAAATRKRFLDKDIDAKVVINQKTGEYITYRLWYVVDDDDILENVDAQMRETVAQIEFPHANLKVGDTHAVLIENEPFGRISAQQAKQIIMQKLREAEREKVYQQFISMEGTLVHGIVRRVERGNVIVDIGEGHEATILKENMIPRESLKNGERIRAYIEKVNREMRGPQISLSRTAPEFLIQLFTLEVPEIASGNIEIVGAARDAGIRAKIAVRAMDPRIDPVGACVGIRGSRVQSVMKELGAESVDIVLWDEDPEVYIRKAMSPAQISKTLALPEQKIIYLAVAEEQMPKAVGRGGQNVRLASALTGWTINVLKEEEFEQLTLGEQEKKLCKALGINSDLAKKLLAAGYDTVESIAYQDREELLALGIADKRVDELIEKAADYLLAQSFEVEEHASDEESLTLQEMEGLRPEVQSALHAQGLRTQEDLAELSVDELMSYAKISKEEASALILKAREPWFRG